MHKIIHISILLTFYTNLFSQKHINKLFPKSVFTVQYAGSTGFLTLGFSKVTSKNKIEIGFLYGMVPRSLGGLNQSLTLKGTYNPLHLDILKRIKIEPIQTGVFICQNFGETLGLQWGNKYPKGYYWWPRSTRIHFFVSSQVSYKIEKKHFDRIAYYFEANTNDLYLYSYFPNRNTMSLYDIFFFGTGIKLYIK